MRYCLKPATLISWHGLMRPPSKSMIFLAILIVHTKLCVAECVATLSSVQILVQH